MYYARIRFSGLSSLVWKEVTGHGCKWNSDNLRSLYYDMHMLARITLRELRDTPHSNMKITFRLYNEYGETIGDRFYYGNPA